MKYFVVDCRPLDQYSCGHLPGSYQLDPNLVRFPGIIFSDIVWGCGTCLDQQVLSGHMFVNECML